MIKHDSSNFLPMPDDYEPDEYKDKCSQDNKSNSQGTQFLKIVILNQLTILDGRTIGDLAGKFTSIEQQGCSVIDYFAVSKNIQSKTNYMKVQDLTEYSDHKPLSLEIRCPQITVDQSQPLESKYQPAQCRFLFNEDNKACFMGKISTSMHTMQILNENLETITNSDNLTEHVLREFATTRVSVVSNIFLCACKFTEFPFFEIRCKNVK